MLAGLLFLAGCAGELAEDAREVDESAVLRTVLLGGSENVRFSIRCPAEVNAGQKLALVTNEGAAYPLTLERNPMIGRPVFTMAKVPKLNACCSLAELNAAGEPQIIRRGAIRIIRRFRIALSFDDGPATGGAPDDGDYQNSPTRKTLDALDSFRHGPNNSRQGIKAVFFLLTQPDHFLRDTYPKGETADGGALIREEARRGHVVGVHWGGRYFGQTVTHPGRVNLPPYDYTGQGGNPADFGRNALECDLQECIARIRSCSGVTPKFLRPPLWRYGAQTDLKTETAVLDTYRRLGLKMVLTDARYPDGGYAVISAFMPNRAGAFRRNLQRAFLSGEDTLILSMHDSNPYTANSLPRILSMIGEVFSGLRFGGQRGDAGEYLNFADTTQGVEEILESKTRFVLFPGYSPARASR